MVFLAAVMMAGRMRRMIGEIAKSNPHVMVNRTRDGDGYAETEDAMHRGQGIDIAILKEEQTGSESPDQRRWCQDGIWQMRKRE
jgi:hypothetical protein